MYKLFKSKRNIMAFILVVLVTSCSFINDKKVTNYADGEIERNEKIIKNILRSINIDNVEVYSLPHLRYGRSEVSKNINNESFSGEGVVQEGPSDKEGHYSPPEYKSLENPYNTYSSFDLTVNYNDKGRSYLYLDYISYLIILDEEFSDKKKVLEESLSKLILNRNRIDVLTIQIK